MLHSLIYIPALTRVRCRVQCSDSGTVIVIEWIGIDYEHENEHDNDEESGSGSGTIREPGLNQTRASSPGIPDQDGLATLRQQGRRDARPIIKLTACIPAH